MLLRPQLFPIFFPVAWSLSSSPIIRQAGAALCNESSLWQPDGQAWRADDTDQNLRAFWSKVRSQSNERFDVALGRMFGSNDFQCSIESPCEAPDCFEIQNLDQPAWVYLAAASVQNLNQMFVTIYNGIELGEDDGGLLSNDLADRFFKWPDPDAQSSDDAVNWVNLALCIIGSFVPGLAAWVEGLTDSIYALLQNTSKVNRESGIDLLNDLFYDLSSTARAAIDSWAHATFAGAADQNNHTILDYLDNGTFVDQAVIPTETEVETYYRSSLIARAVNLKWRTQSAYIVGTSADMKHDNQFPSNDSWTSPRSGRTYVPYFFDGRSQLSLPGLDALDQTFYSVTASQVAEASARAWEVAGFNYTDAVALRRVQDSFSDPELTPFRDGVSWEGTFTLPVCDVGDHSDWLVPYGGRLLPCCCGPDCSQTHAFVQAANLNHSQDWRDICHKQLKGTSLDFDTIDYGIDAGSKAHQFWHSLGKGGKAGFIIAVVLGIFISWIVLCAFCCK